MPWLRTRPLCAALCACIALWSGVCRGQAAASPMDSYTLHVSSSMLQLPVLVTDRYNEPVTRLDTSRFRIQFLNGPTVVPKLVRPEGNDPITLGILLDGRVALPMLGGLPEAMAAMARKELRPADRVALWGTDGCHLRRFADLSSPDADGLRDATAKALTYKPARGPDCGGPRHLWDAMAFGVGSLAGEPGRRVLLVLTGGDDMGSNYSSNQLVDRAVAAGVAVFAVTPSNSGGAAWAQSPTSTPYGSRGMPSTSTVPVDVLATSYLATVTARNGGTVLETSSRSMPQTLARFVAMLRARYIMEFARPAGLAPGQNTFRVILGTSDNYTITSAGTSMPLPETPDPALQHGTLQKAPTTATNP